MKRNLASITAILGALWLIATGVLLFYIANLAPIQALLLAFVIMDGAFLLLLALLITTNTRVQRQIDPYALETDELLRPPLYAGEDRRAKLGTVDDRMLTLQRITDMVERAAALRPLSERTSGLFRDDEPTTMFRDPPPNEVKES